MVSRNNVSLLNKRLIEREKPHFALRKTTLGLASVLLSTTFYMGTQVVHADTVPLGSDAGNSNGQSEEMTNQTTGFETESSANPQAQTQNQTLVNNNAANTQTQAAVQSAGNQNTQGQPQQKAVQTTTQAVDETLQKSVQSQNQKQTPQNFANQALTSAIDPRVKTDGANQAVSQVLSQSSNAERNHSLNKLPSSITPVMLMTNLVVKPSDSYTSSAALEKIDFYAWSDNFKEMSPNHPITINIDQANTRIGFDGKFRLTRDQLTKQNTIRLFDVVQTSDSSAYNVISLENNDSAFVLDGKQIGHYHLVIDERINDGIYQPNPKFKKLTLELVITDPLTNVIGSREIDANAPWIGTMSWSTPWAFRGMGSNSNITLSIQGQNTLGSQYKEDYHITYHKDPVSTRPIGINDNKDSYVHLLPQSGVAADGRMGLVLDAMHPGWSDKNWVNQFLSNHGTSPSINLNQYVERAARYSADGQSVIINASDQPKNVVHYGSMPAFNNYGQMYPESQSLSQPIGTASNVTIFPQNTSMLAMKRSGKTGYMVSQQDDGTVILYVKIPLTDLRVQESQRNNVVGSVIYTSSRINKVVTNDEQARQMANQWFSDWINGAQKGVPLNFSEIGPVARITSPFEHTTLHAQQLDVNTGLPIAGEDFTNTNVINDAKANGQVEVRVHYINNSTGAEIAQSKDFVDWPSAGKQVNVQVPTINGYTLVTNLDGSNALKLTDGTTKQLNGTIVSNGNGLAYPESVSTTNNGVADYYFVYQKKVAQQANIQIQYVDDSGNVISTDSNKILLNSQNQQATLSNLTYPHRSDTTYGWQIGPLDFVDEKGKSHVLTGLKLNVATGAPEFLMSDGEVFTELTTADHKAHVLVDQGNHNYVLKISVAFFAKVILQEIDETTGKVVYSGESRTVAGTSGHYDSSNQMFAHYVWAPDQPAIDFTVNNKDSTQYIKIKVTPKIDDISKDTTDPNGNKLDISRTVTRTINIKDLGGHTTTQKQSVTFTRSASYNEVTKQVSYGAWSEDGRHVFADQTNQVPTIDGYTINPNGGSIGTVTVTPDSKSIVTNVTYDANEQTVTVRYVYNGQAVGTYQVKGKTNEHISLADVASSNKPAGYSIDSAHVANNFSYTFTADPNQHYDVPVIQSIIDLKPGDSRVPVSDFSRTITRTITMNIPKATPKVITQSVTFNRDVKWNQVTNKPIYGVWSEDGQDVFPAVSIIDIPGYQPDKSVDSLTVTPDSSSSTVTVSYIAQPQGINIKYVDINADNKVVQTVPVKGVTGQTMPINIVVPAGYVLVDGQSTPKQITFMGTGNSDVTVQLKEKVNTVNSNDPSTWPAGVTEHDLKRTITRTVTITKPDHTSSTKTQSVTFTRGATYNEVTKQVAYQPWSENGSHTFPVVPIPDIPGYKPDKSVDALTVNPDSTDSTVTVNYIAQPQMINVNYVDVDANHKLVEAVPIKGVTDQTVSVDVAVPDGYALVDGQSISKSITFKASANADITVQLKEKIDTVDINDPKTWPAGLTEHDLKRTITRDVTINNPDSTHSSQHQSVTFTRGATYNEVTKQVAYDAWSDNGEHTFDAVPIPPIRGYAPSQEVPALMVTPDSSDITETVTYRALGQSLVVHYLDLTNKPVDDQVLKGVTDQMIDVDLHLPTGWVLAPGQNVPKQIKFNGIHNVDMNVYVVHQITPVDPNNPSTIPNDYPLDQNAWKRDISRTVNITEPNGHQSSQTQSTEFTRSVSFDQVLKQYIFGPWSKDGMDTFAEITIPSHPGYAPSATAPKEIVTPDSKSEVVEVTYVANGQTTSYSFVDDDNNGSKVGEDYFISGRTDETVPLSISIPGGYQLAANQTLPKTYHFASSDNQPLVIHLQHVLVDATNDPKADTTRTITRTIEITNPDNKVTTDSQSVKFTRTAKKDVVTGNYIYGDWSNNGHQRFEAYLQPSLKGYNKTGSVPQVDVTPDTKDIKVELGYTKQPLRRLDPNDPLTWTKGLTHDDFERDISRTVTLHAPNMQNPRVTKQSVTFMRDIYQDPVTDQLIYKDWQVSAGNPKFNAVSVPHVKGYQASVEDIPAVTAAPDTKSSAVDVTYTQLADKQIDPNDPHTWPSNISEYDLKRTIKRTIEFDNPDGTKSIKVQSMIFVRRAHQNQVTDQIIFNPWSENGSHQFGAVEVPAIKGYQPSLVRVSALNVTPDSQNSTVKINYTKLPDLVVDPSDPATWIDGLLEHDLKRTIKRTIVFNVPNGQAETKVQTVTFVRGAKIDQVTDKITFDPWSENGDHQFDAVMVPTFKGYDANPGLIASWRVTPDSQDLTVNVAYNKQANRVIDPNDPKTWPDGIGEHDLKRTVTRTITIHTPNAKPQVISQSVTFVRGASQDPVTDKITFDPWSENGQHQFGIVNVPKVKGYDASRSIVPGVVVTPDSKSFETVDVVYTKQANRRIDPNDPSTWPKGLNPDDLKRTISREIVFALPNGSSQKVLQTITFTRDGSQDPVSDKITWGPWSDNGKHRFDEVPVTKVKGYTSNINRIDGLDVTPDTKLPNGGRVSVVYAKQPDSQIDPNNPSTWPSGVTVNDVKRTITRTITFQLPDGTSKQVTQTVTFTRGGSVDAVTDKITWQPWSEDGKHHFDRVNVPQFKGYNSSIDMIDGLDVTPDTKLPNGGSIIIEYTKQANLMIDPNDPSAWPDGVTKDDMFRHIERDIVYQLPDGTKHTIHQGVDFTRSGEIDPVTGKITWHPWSHNGKYHFDNVNLPHVRGYVSNPLFISGLDVTPDTKLSGADAEIVVSYIKQANKLLTINDPSSWPRGMTADDFKKAVTRTINFHLPTGLKTQVQTVTLLRTGELDAITGQVIWNRFDMGQFEAVKVPQVDGYQASLNEVPEMPVDGDSKNLVVDVNYRAVEKHDDNGSDQDKNLMSSTSTDTGETSQGLVLGAKSASMPINNRIAASSTSTIASVSLMGSNTNSVSNSSSNQKSDKQAVLPQTGSNRNQAAVLGLAGIGLLLGASELVFKKKRI